MPYIGQPIAWTPCAYCNLDGRENPKSTRARKKVNSKCYKCERRHPACQDKCPDYLAWKANLDATNAKIKDEKKKFEDMGSYQYETAKRLRKSK